MPARSNKPLIVTAGVALLLVVMLLVGAGLAAWSTQRTLETLRLVDHTRQVRLELERMLVAIVGAEGALRGFLLTGDDAFIATIDRSLADSAGAFHAANSLTQDNPRQQIRLQHLSTALGERTSRIRQQVSHDARESMTPEQIRNATMLGKQNLNEIRRLIREMEDVEDHLLEERAAAARRASSETGILVTLGTIVAVILILTSIVIVWRDVTARKQGAIALLEARHYADAIVDTVRDALVVLDFEFRVERANRSFYQMFNLSPASVHNHPLVELSDGAWNDEGLLRQFAALSGGEEEFHDLEVERRFPNLGARIMSVSGRKLDAQSGGANAVLLSIEDITERKQAERKVSELNAELHRRAKLLEVANVELEAFSYSVSHDLRAPLRHIDGFAEMLRKHLGDALDDKAKRFLTTISDSAKRMGTLIDDLLLFSRMGRAEMKQTMVDLDQVLDDALKEVPIGGEQRTVELQRFPLPTVRGDRALLRQVFVNLLSNALKYSRRRDRALIEIGTAPAEVDEIAVYVKDNGVGFDMTYAKKLFGVFQRLHRTDEFEGTGIGLANVRRIISRHGGGVWADSKVGEGATFYFSLPRQVTSADAQPEPNRTP